MIAAALAEDADLLGHVGFDLLGRAVGQQLLLVDGAPEGEPVAQRVLKLLRIVAGHVGLHRVEHVHADLDQVFEDGRDGAVGVDT